MVEGVNGDLGPHHHVIADGYGTVKLAVDANARPVAEPDVAPLPKVGAPLDVDVGPDLSEQWPSEGAAKRFAQDAPWHPGSWEPTRKVQVQSHP